ncbi:MAG: RNA methyltransferase [Fibrobacter sp.]|nr:RNA methyltransferase [Fibrobacter sp.]
MDGNFQNSSAFEKRIKRQIIGKPHRFLAIAPLGFEQTLAREIEFCNPQVVGDGKVEFTAKITEAWKAVAYTRVANRIMMHIADFKAENFRDLEKKASEIPWELYLLDERLHIHVTCKHSRLYHSDAVAERLYKVIEGGSLPLASATRHPRPFDMLRAGSGGDLPVSFTTPSAGGQHLGACSLVRMATKVGTPRNAPPQNLYVTLIDDRCTLWLDLAGEELYKRGHERFVNDAPLKETIAAAMLFEAIEFATAPSLDPSTTPSRASLRMTQCCLLDLMAGSGTFSLEAAYMASGLIPGKCRDFALKHQPAFKPATWKHIVSSMDSLAPTGLRNDYKKAQEPANVTPKRDATIVTPKREAQVCPIANIITSDISERAVNIIRHNLECSPLAQSTTSEQTATGAQSMTCEQPATSISPQVRDFFTYTAKEIADACCARNNASIPATRDKDKHATRDKHAASDNDTQPVIVLNPPYGKRLDFDAPALYTRIGKKLAELARELEPFGKKLTVAILAPNDDPRPGSKFTCTANLLRECPALDPQRNPSARRIATSHGGLGLGAFIAQI